MQEQSAESSYKEAIEILHEAVKKADINEVIDILKRMNNEEVMGVALCKSVIADDISLVQAILHHIKITNVSDNFFKKRKCNYDDSPLIIACQYGNPEIVSLLCGFGFLINVVDEHNQTPLLAAVAIGHGSRDIQNQKKRIVSLLIEKGADINITDLKHSRTPLHLVCFEGTLEVVRNLLDNGANINARDSYGKTPLFYCLRTDFHREFSYDITRPGGRAQIQSYFINPKEGNKIMKYLVERGADINCRDHEDQSVLDHAYQTCRPFATFLLFKYAGMIRRNCRETIRVLNWYGLITENLADARFWRHLVIHTSVCRRIYLDFNNSLNHSLLRSIGYDKTLKPFFSIKSDTEIPLSLKDQCRICIRNTISTYTEPGLQFEKCINTLCMPKTLKSFLMFEELEQFVSVRDDLLE